MNDRALLLGVLLALCSLACFVWLRFDRGMGQSGRPRWTAIAWLALACSMPGWTFFAAVGVTTLVGNIWLAVVAAGPIVQLQWWILAALSRRFRGALAQQ